MFKKLKDKLTEEVKIPSQKFTQSMQQLAQAVVSPGSSNNSAYDAASNDNFSIDGDFDDTPQSSPMKKSPSDAGVAYRGGQATSLGNSFDSGSGAGFTHVDLQQDTSIPKTPSGPGTSFSDALSSLRSSRSSLASDSSFMFPVLESAGSTYNFQSDLESCSEASESVGPNINKEQLLIAYQKTQQKYHKYKGRYTDLARHYRDLERDNKNAKHVLTECQDKALRRMAELKEQCNLEKQAKAHLEEALRSDLEEKDHLIHTLKTKIKLLRNQVDQVQAPEPSEAVASNEASAEKISKPPGQEDLLTGGDSGPAASILTPEPVSSDSDNALKEKLKKLESLLHKCKEDITNKRENIKQLEADKHAATSKIESLQQQLITIQKREEEASLSLAKNKQTIHRELESKEEEIKKLKAQLTATNCVVSELQKEIVQIKEDSKKELAAGKLEATKLIKAEMENLVLQNKTLEGHVAARENDCKENEERVSELVNRLEQLKGELNPLKKERDELTEKFNDVTRQLNEKISDLENRLVANAEKDSGFEKLKPILLSVQELYGFQKQLKNDFVDLRHDSLAWVSEQAQLTQESIQNIITCMTEEHKKTLSELDEYKRESLSAKESLATVSDKVVLLEEAVSKEKKGVESKMTDLEKEFMEAEQQIASLKQSLETEKELRLKLEEESSKSLSQLEKKLEEEREQIKLTFDASTSSELKLKSEVERLMEQIKESEDDKAKYVQDYEKMKERVSSLSGDVEQLQMQLESMESRNNELISDCERLKKSIDEKNVYVAKLETTLSELKESDERRTAELSSVMAQKNDLEQEWKLQQNDLMTQLSTIKDKYEEATHALDNIRKKELTESDDNETKIRAMQSEIEEREKQIVALQIIARNHEATSARNVTLEKELEEVITKGKNQEAAVLSLQETNQTLSQSLQQLQHEVEGNATLIFNLQSTNADLEKDLANKNEFTNQLAVIEDQLRVKTRECETLTEKLEGLSTSQLELKEVLQVKGSECNALAQEIEKLNLTLSDETNKVRLKTEECLKLTSQLENMMIDLSSQGTTLEEKVKECENYQQKLSSIEQAGAVELNNKIQEHSKLIAVVDSLEKDKLELVHTLEAKNGELALTVTELQSLKQDHEKQSNVLEEKISEYNKLASKLEALTVQHTKTSQLLKQKTMDCEDKEAQLDNLADEMKRVEELSQELHRINDDRDANVEVLSSEASSLAQKVEELTLSTQELKEREVELLDKLQVAEELQTEYIAVKQREEMLLSKLNGAKTLEKDLMKKEEDLMLMSQKIEALEEENTKLRDAGQNLTAVINRAKEAEAKCEKLQEDGANVLLRIQKAEEFELRCSLLAEELEVTKKEKEELLKEMQMLQSKTVFKGNLSEGKSGDSHNLKEPVIEELCVVKRYADLTEDDPNFKGDEKGTTSEVNEWREKYNKLLEQHHKVVQENAEEVERLKEESLLAMRDNIKQKERLWDRQDPLSSIADGTSNGSFGTVEKLQQQLATLTSQLKESKRIHRQEVDDLRRILLNHGSSNSRSASRSDNLEDATELEYLRNILFEYMMGKEPMILARVIAAVVKFDSDQTSKVMQKEQQRLSLKKCID